MTQRRRKKKQTSPLVMIAAFTLIVFYMEAVFSFATSGGVVGSSIIYMFLFSAVIGILGYLISTLGNKTFNIIVLDIWLTAMLVLYIVQFLIYKQFKIFYDIDTVTNGAGGVLTEFLPEIFTLVFLKGGIFVMLALALPVAVINLLWFTKRFTLRRTPMRIKVLALSLGVLLHIFTFLLVMVNPVTRQSYRFRKVQFDFNDAVSNFGLVTGTRLDVQKEIFGVDIEFEGSPMDNIKVPSKEDDPEEPTGTGEATEPIEYGYNVLDIDFDKLNKSASKKQKSLNDYVQSVEPTQKNEMTGLFKGKNLIFLSAEAFSAELIDPELTPTLYRLATKGVQFTDYYQPAGAGTTGGEYQNIFGMLPSDGGKSFKNTADHYNYYTMGTQLDKLGYYGKAFHNNSYTYYSRNKTHINLGYSDGFMGYGNGMEQYVKKAWPQSDYEMISGTVPTFIDKQPFNVYYMTVSGHNNYGVGNNSQTKKHWDRVQHLPYSDEVKGYYAANLDLEDALTWLVAYLEEQGIADDTVICLSADHFPYGLDSDAPLGKMPYLSELYGYEVLDYFQRDHSRLILWCGMLEDMEPIVVDTPTFSLDILPTLFNLFGVEYDSRLLPGRDVFSDAPALVYFSNGNWRSELGTYSKGKFVPVSEDVVIPENYVKNVNAIVKNKINYCSGVLDTDYFRLVFD